MLEPPRLSVRANIEGLLRGADLSGEGVITLSGDMIELESGRRRVTIPVAALDGMQERDGALELCVATGDVIHISGAADLVGLSRELVQRAFSLPEMMLSLRGFGSHRAQPGAEHVRFFDLLLEARRRAEQARDTDELVRAFDAPKLRAEVEQRLKEFAAERYPDSSADRRAVFAELSDCAAALLAEIDALSGHERALLESESASQFANWRRWSDAVRRIFERADACWFGMLPILDAPVRRRERWWRRLVPFARKRG
ncbi:MAG: hypothetical protein ACREON_17470 [Gemmatimonadaceae bacterium]